jgi:hypothetical protein
MALALGACALAPTGVFARVEVACGAKSLIYSNAEKFDEDVTVRATDACTGLDSEVQLLDADGKVLQTFAIPDGTTKDVRVSLRSGQWLNFVCNGKEGGCSYAVTSK